MKVITETRLAH